MVRGIEKFKEFFADFKENYVIIGGTACDMHEEENGLTPRATKDIDMILVVEALDNAFVEKFWTFVKNAGYQQRNIGTVEKPEYKHEYFRFKDPQEKNYPFQIELFSRKIGLLNYPEDAHLTPIPTGEELSSLSAILMNTDYYEFTIKHSTTKEDVHIANIESLICLKCKAYLEMAERKAAGDQVDERDIEKHKKDVFRLAGMLSQRDKFTLPATLKEDIQEFCNAVKGNLPNQDFLKAAGLGNVKGETLLQNIKSTFMMDD